MSDQFFELGSTLDDWAASFHSVTESLNEGLILADNDGIIRFANSRFTELTGFERSEIVGRRIYEVFCPPGSEELMKEAERMRSRYEARRAGISENYETLITRKDGQRRWIETKAAPLYNADKKIIGSIGANFDITDRKLLEEQVRWSQKMEAVGRLAGGVAHDFNNLLTVIQGYADLLRHQLLPDDPRVKKIDVIREASEAASTLTQQLLSISRRQIVRMQLMSVNDVVERSLRVVQGLIGEKIDLVTELEPDLPPIRGDAGQVQQVLLNLVVNARDAMPDGGTLYISTDLMDGVEVCKAGEPVVEDRHSIRLRVRDTGHGMDADVKSRLFEPFFTTKRKGRGSGLGLSTTFGIVEEHEGEIRVDSEPGNGATFDVNFPAKVGREASVALHTEWRVLTGSEVVLVAEDQTAVRILLRETLERYGYTVLEGHDGRDALDLARKFGVNKIDLLVTDVIMPRMNGLELAHEMLAENPRLRLMMISGYADDPQIVDKIKTKGVAFLAKPFGPESLVRNVRAVLDSPIRPSLAGEIERGYESQTSESESQEAGASEAANPPGQHGAARAGALGR